MARNKRPEISQEDAIFYLDQSPLLQTFLDDEINDMNTFLEKITPQVSEVIDDLESKLGKDRWTEILATTILMFNSLGLHPELKPIERNAVLLLLVSTGYQIGNIEGVFDFAVPAYSRLKELDLLKSDKLEPLSYMSLAVNAVLGTLRVGSYLKVLTNEDDTSLSAFEDFLADFNPSEK